MRNFGKVVSAGAWSLIICVMVSSGIPIRAYADDIVPNTFSPGATISSNQVNQNFTALSNATPRTRTAVMLGPATLSSAYQNLASLTITPTDNGTLILFGNANITINQGSAGQGQSHGYSSANLCVSTVSNANSSGTCAIVQLDTLPLGQGVPVLSDSPRITVPATAFGGGPATKGVPVTYYLTGAVEQGSVGASTVTGGTLTAIFIRGGL